MKQAKVIPASPHQSQRNQETSEPIFPVLAHFRWSRVAYCRVGMHQPASWRIWNMDRSRLSVASCGVGMHQPASVAIAHFGFTHYLAVIIESEPEPVSGVQSTLPPKHHIIQKQLALKISAISPKIPLIQSHLPFMIGHLPLPHPHTYNTCLTIHLLLCYSCYSEPTQLT